MRLYAISDLHIGQPVNWAALQELRAYPEDWLVIAGDVGETFAHLRSAFDIIVPRFERVIWVPGNHELWTVPASPYEPRGQERYERLVEECRRYGVLTPEDPYVEWRGAGGPCLLAPLFLLYDYSFRPGSMPPYETIAWARASGIACVDERVLDHAPFESRSSWCAHRCAITEQRLGDARLAHPDLPIVAINHYPLMEEFVDIPAIPRFSPWCGTRRTEDWCSKFGIDVVVYGHLHRRSTKYRQGVRWEEVSLGYPRQWQPTRGIASYLREILPGDR